MPRLLKRMHVYKVRLVKLAALFHHTPELFTPISSTLFEIW
jgi:hypothetical protein